MVSKKFLSKNDKVYLKNIEGSYFDFLRKKRGEGFRQIIISSNILFGLLINRVRSNNALIKKIEIQREDEDVQRQLDSLIETANQKKEYYDLFNFLMPVDFNDSIEIKCVKYSYRNPKFNEVEIFNNGLVHIFKDGDKESKALVEFVERSRGNNNAIY